LRPRIEFLLLIAGVSQLSAQVGGAGGRDVDLRYGRWYSGNQSKSYELRTDAPIAGIFSQGLALQILIHDSLGRHRAFYGAGWQLHAFRRRATVGPYALAGVSLGVSTDTSSQELAALWTLGGGIEWRPIRWAALGLETVVPAPRRRAARLLAHERELTRWNRRLDRFIGDHRQVGGPPLAKSAA